MKTFTKYKNLTKANRGLLKKFHYRVFKFQRPKWRLFLMSKTFRSLFVKYRQSKFDIFHAKTIQFLIFKSYRNSFLKQKSFVDQKVDSFFSKLHFRYFNKNLYHDKKRLITFFVQKSKTFLLKDLSFLLIHKLTSQFMIKKIQFFFYFSKCLINFGLKVFPGFSMINKNFIFENKSDVTKRKKNTSVFNSYLVKNKFDFLEKVKNHPKNLIQTKRLWYNIFEKSLNINAIERKNNFFLSKRGKILKYLIKPQFRLNILLWNLYFFSSPKQALQEISKKYISVNDEIVFSNLFLQKGDVVSLNHFDKKSTYFKSFSKNYSFIRRHLTFVEIDFETEIVILIKNFTDLNLNDFFFIVNDSLVLKNLK